MMGGFYSQLAGERRNVEIDFSDLLASGESIESANATIATIDGSGTGALTGVAPTEAGDAVDMTASADEAGTYLIEATASTNKGQTLKREAALRVLAGAGSQAGGYASPIDLQIAYGSAEIARLGGDAGVRMERALKVASADVTGYLARYQLPLGPGPWPLLVEATCAIARRLLYDDEVPEAVRTGEKSARSRLWGSYFGSVVLRDEEGAEAPRLETATAQFVADDPVFTTSALEDF